MLYPRDEVRCRDKNAYCYAAFTSLIHTARPRILAAICSIVRHNCIRSPVSRFPSSSASSQYHHRIIARTMCPQSYHRIPCVQSANSLPSCIDCKYGARPGPRPRGPAARVQTKSSHKSDDSDDKRLRHATFQILVAVRISYARPPAHAI
ncbi:hypothetical protein K437DRAFT_145464 [Tilletiaria anomala UBC 951]|uniref:Uncharacterized protein n=1 Tax=Tilletiaria anomala (strain ATCC 24038 / CBS 436.72 / UBC 951) TaxID=1037660 RepID=A0A066VZH8_TILAU|nr:uncharacterized protein K437DRAFT_145464 [Tilletiaria anomala UBC 951]KDN43925.1 hypothetical protein K437DRAFT_145464 [Tilletiaria anomala UBC 951]